MNEAPTDDCKYLNGAPMSYNTLMTHRPYSFPGAVAFSYIEDDADSAGGTGNATGQYYGDRCPRRPSDLFTSIARDTSTMQPPGPANVIRHASLDSSAAQLQRAKDFETQLQRQHKRYLALFGHSAVPKTGWERLGDGQIACHDKKLLFATAVQCRNYLGRSGAGHSPAAVAREEGAAFLAHLDKESSEERSRLRTVQKSAAKQKNALNQEMKVRVDQLQKVNRRLVHETTALARQLAKLQAQQQRELEAAQATQQRALESVARLMQFCAGLPPFVATLRHKPVSRRVVVVVALGPSCCPSEEDGRGTACRFSDFAAVNEADLLCLSLPTRVPGLKPPAAQLMKTRIEEHVFRTHGAGHDWDRVCVVDAAFGVPDGYVRVFDEVSEEGVLVVQPRPSAVVHPPQCKGLPSLLMLHAGHAPLLARARRAFVRDLFACTTKSQGCEAAQDLGGSLTAACAELGIPVCVRPELRRPSANDSGCATEDGSESGSEGLTSADSCTSESVPGAVDV